MIYDSITRTVRQVEAENRRITGGGVRRAEYIRDMVAKYNGVNILEKTHRRDVVIARYIAVKFIVEQTNLGTVKIGAILGIDHSTVLWGFKQIKNWSRYPEISRQITEIKELLNR